MHCNPAMHIYSTSVAMDCSPFSMMLQIRHGWLVRRHAFLQRSCGHELQSLVLGNALHRHKLHHRRPPTPYMDTKT